MQHAQLPARQFPVRTARAVERCRGVRWRRCDVRDGATGATVQYPQRCSASSSGSRHKRVRSPGRTCRGGNRIATPVTPRGPVMRGVTGVPGGHGRISPASHRRNKRVGYSEAAGVATTTDDAKPIPTLFSAATTQAYSTPFVISVTTTGLAAPEPRRVASGPVHVAR